MAIASPAWRKDWATMRDSFSRRRRALLARDPAAQGVLEQAQVPLARERQIQRRGTQAAGQEMRQ